MMDIAQATHLDVEARPGYWEDAKVNGVEEDNDAPTIFGVSGDTWRIRINIAEGRIEGWPKNMEAEIHYKVCDDGEYWLSNADGQRVAKWRDYYVPGEYLCHGDNGYGDYIIMNVSGMGFINNYMTPALDYECWEVLPPVSAKAMSASGQDQNGLGAQPASAVRQDLPKE